VTNVFMPEQDGLEAIKALRAIVPDLPIISMSGGAFGGKVGSGSVLSTASRLGASCTFQKPFDAPAFVGAVRDLLGPAC
jgi:CheY-like chemotaxis protein